MTAAVHDRYVNVDDHTLPYREAGFIDAAGLALLHGFPSSSLMFRDLIPRLAAQYRSSPRLQRGT